MTGIFSVPAALLRAAALHRQPDHAPLRIGLGPERGPAVGAAELPLPPAGFQFLTAKEAARVHRRSAVMLQATITLRPSDRALATSSSLSEPGFRKSSLVPFFAISSITFMPVCGGR